MKVSFAIGGMIHVVRDYLLSGTKYSIEQLIDSTAYLFELLLEHPTKAAEKAPDNKNRNGAIYGNQRA